MNREILADRTSLSARDAAAERRDHDAQERDRAAETRDRRAARGEQVGAAEQRGSAARDRALSAEDRRLSAVDRRAARHELAYEGIDALTGVMRRGVGSAAIQREMDRAERSGESLLLAFVDIVGLKAVNDSRGHRAGDRVLREVAECITNDLRSYDVVARVGGDEFICTLAGQSVLQAEDHYREIRRRLADGASGARITVGLAGRRAGDSLEDLVDRADQAMLAVRR